MNSILGAAVLGAIQLGQLLNTTDIAGTVTVGAGASVNAGGVVSVAGLPIVGTTTTGAGSSVKTPGTVSVVGLPIVGTTVVGAGPLVETPGTVSVAGIPIVGTTVVGAGSLVKTPGIVGAGIEIDGTVTVGAGSSVNAGGIVGPGIEVDGTVTVGAGSSVNAGGVVGSTGIPIIGTILTGPGSFVVPGGVLYNLGIPIVGTVTAGAGQFVPDNGAIGFGILLHGNVVVSSLNFVYPGGMLYNLGIPIVGFALVTSTNHVFTGGTVGMAVTPPSSGNVSGHGVPYRWTRRRNDYALQLLAEARMQREMFDVTEPYSLKGLGSLEEILEGTNCGEKVNLRKNFFERGSVVTPAPIAGDVTVLQWKVPIGYYGHLLGYYTSYTGTGLVPGSGDITWRLKLGNAWVRDMGDVPYALGSLIAPMPLAHSIYLVSNDLVTFLVNVPNTSGAIQVGASRILCGLQGWLYPMTLERRLT